MVQGREHQSVSPNPGTGAYALRGGRGDNAKEEVFSILVSLARLRALAADDCSVTAVLSTHNQ